MTIDLKGRAGLVTGAAGGIGRASAIALGAAGAAVIVSDLEAMRDGGEETAQLIRASGGDSEFVPCDVTESAQCEDLVEATIAAYGRLDFAHNNAGIGMQGRLVEATEDDFDLCLAVNLAGVWHGMKAQIPRMTSAGGAIVNTASLAGLIGLPHGGIYAASKHAVLGITKTAAIECADLGIRVNAVCPAAIATPMTAGLPPELREQAVAPQAIKRFGEPREVGEAVAWLCSDSASFITGIGLPIDGGATAG